MRALVFYMCTLTCYQTMLSNGYADVISYLRFEEGAGTIALDQTGLLDGTFEGNWYATEGWSTDVATSFIPQTGEANNFSLRFGGGSEYIDLSNANDLNLGNEFTIEFYMKPDQPIVASVMFGFSPGSGLAFSLWEGSDSLLRGQFNETIGSQFPANIRIDEWQHFALVMQTNQYVVYIDGISQYSANVPEGGEGPYIFPGYVAQGSRTIGGPTGTWRGYIDEFRISDEALTPDQFLCAVPEPATFVFFVAGLAFLMYRRWSSS